MLTDDLTGEHDRFSIPISDIPEDVLYEVARKRGLDGYSLPEGTEVQYWEIEPALEDMDDRRDHERALDAALQSAVEKMDERAYDLILTEVDYDLMDRREEGAISGDRWYQGEIDVMMVNIDDGIVRAAEVKPHRGSIRDHNGQIVVQAPTHEQKADRQHERQAYAFDLLNEEVDGFDMHYIPADTVYEKELLPGNEIPDAWDGRYRGREKAVRAMEESEEFRTFMEEFVLPENPEIFAPENRLTRKETGLDEFVEEYLDENSL